MVRVVLYDLTYLSFFKISFRQVSIVIDVVSIVYFRFQNYHDTDVVFVSDNIVSFSFSMKNCESESGETFYRSFPTVFILYWVALCIRVPGRQERFDQQDFSLSLKKMVSVHSLSVFTTRPHFNPSKKPTPEPNRIVTSSSGDAGPSPAQEDNRLQALSRVLQILFFFKKT